MREVVISIIVGSTILAYCGVLTGDQYVQIVMSIIAGIVGWKAGEVVMRYRLRGAGVEVEEIGISSSSAS